MKYLFLLLIFLGAPAMANSQLERTAIEALRVAKHSPTGKEFEHGGMLIGKHTDYGYVVEYLEPQPHGSATGVTVFQKDLLAVDNVLVGSYHIHLCMADYYHAYFSATDVITALFSGVPEFMLDECTGDVHEFDPRVDKIRGPGSIDAHISGDHGESLARHLPAGRIIGNIGETEPEHVGP